MVILLFLGSHEILVICVFSSFTSLLIPVSVLILFLQSSVHISGISVIFTWVSLPSVSSCLTLVVFCLSSLVLLPLSRYSWFVAAVFPTCFLFSHYHVCIYCPPLYCVLSFFFVCFLIVLDLYSWLLFRVFWVFWVFKEDSTIKAVLRSFLVSWVLRLGPNPAFSTGFHEYLILCTLLLLSIASLLSTSLGCISNNEQLCV